MDIKHLQIPFELKDFDSETGIFEGYSSIFNVVDDGNDRVLPGAFTKSINLFGPNGRNRIKILVMHQDKMLPIGKPLELREDTKGLFVKGKISDTVIGRDVKTLIKDGVFTELSIGYTPNKFHFDSNGIRNLEEVKLFEISPVIWAMNSHCAIDDYKQKEQNVKKGGNSSMEFVIGKKAITFEDAFNVEKLEELRWKIHSALRETIESIMCDSTLNKPGKILAIQQALNSYQLAILELYNKLITIQDDEAVQVEANVLLAKAEAILIEETKVGAKLSNTTKTKLKQIMKLLEDVLGVEDEEEKTAEDDLEVKKQQELKQIDTALNEALKSLDISNLKKV